MKKQHGFTLVEAAVAIGVVAILSGIIIPLVLRNIRAAQIARARNDIHVIAAAIAAQLRDTGTRPRIAPGGAAGVVTPNGATGDGDANWYSMATMPTFLGGAGAFAPTPNNTFDNLFSAPNNNAVGGFGVTTMDQANTLFGFAVPQPAGVEHGYKGPYMSLEDARKSDPWGNAYLILGYNVNGQGTNGPIWVVSAGPNRRIFTGNVTPIGAAGTPYRSQWDFTVAPSDDDIVQRVN